MFARFAKMRYQKMAILGLQIQSSMNAQLVHLLGSDLAYTEEFLDRQLLNKLDGLMRFDYCNAIRLFEV